MKMHNLRDLVENAKEMPTGRCWESIEQQLSVMMPSSPASQGAASGQQIASGIKSSIMQKSAAFWVKAAAVTVSSIAVTTVAVVTLINVSKNQSTSTVTTQPIPSDEITVVAENDSLVTIPEDKSVINSLSDNKITPNNKSAIVESTPITIQNNQSTNQITKIGNISSNNQSPVKPILAPNSPTASLTNSSVKPALTSQPTMPQNLREDPVIQNMDQDEQLEISNPIIIEIPNVITPNGDGYNEKFVISGIEQCDKSRLIIRNKNGKILYQTQGYENDWGADGLEAGIYYYQFFYTIHNIEEIRSGTLTVIK